MSISIEWCGHVRVVFNWCEWFNFSYINEDVRFISVTPTSSTYIQFREYYLFFFSIRFKQQLPILGLYFLSAKTTSLNNSEFPLEIMSIVQSASSFNIIVASADVLERNSTNKKKSKKNPRFLLTFARRSRYPYWIWCESSSNQVVITPLH
jgi:hypothetical protein